MFGGSSDQSMAGEGLRLSKADRIVEVRATAIAIPLTESARFSTREVAVREYVLVEVVTGDGASGTGYTYVGANSGRSVTAFVESALGPMMIGRTPSPEFLWESLYRETLLLGRRGLALRAMSAVDIALWDLLGKRANLPLSVLLGGTAASVPAYASGGYYRPGDPIKNVVRELTNYMDLGFRDFKIKVGGADRAIDVERVRVARETIGKTARLALDANNAWGTAREALRFIDSVSSFDLWWIEEPLMPDDIEGHSEISRRSEVPIATGEIHATRWDFEQLIRSGSADILQPDAGVCGGVTEWMKIAHEAQSHNLPVAPHWHANIHVHLAAAVSNCIAVEYFVLANDVYNFERIVEEPLQIRDGLLAVPSGPGLGLKFDSAALAKYRH